MIRVDIRETIARPIEDVFEQLIDIARYAEWMPRRGLFVASSKDTEGPVRVGTAYTDRTKLLPVPGDVSELERPTKVVFHYTVRLFGRTVMEGWPAYTLERERDGATRVHHTGEAHVYGPFKVLEPWLQRVACAERRRTVDALKRWLESAS